VASTHQHEPREPGRAVIRGRSRDGLRQIAGDPTAGRTAQAQTLDGTGAVTAEIIRIRAALGERALAVEHVGSTAKPGHLTSVDIEEKLFDMELERFAYNSIGQ
jgi:hypothetical protein